MKNNNNKIQKAYFAGGCFWGVEYYFQNLPGVISTKVGYIGGNEENPTYEEVSAKKTGHAETLEVTFDSALVNYVDLAKLFFGIHDPTELNRQGPDIGEQYRSAIFYVNDEQKAITEELIRKLKGKGYAVVTKLEKAGTFWEAENYHQKFYAQNGHSPYCHIRQKKF
jgi:peptide methionine sulfoxide reductase msrA/msrB